MKTFIGLVFIASLALALAINDDECGKRPKFDGKVLSGSVVKDGDHKWQIALTRRLSTGTYSFTCGGSILTPTVVLSAAHCMTPGNSYQVTVTNTRAPLDPFAQVRNVTKFVNHPSYNSRTFDNDISLLFLSEPLVFSDEVGTICIPKKGDPEPKALDICVATGFGSTSSGGAIVNKLLEVYMNITSDEDTTAFYGTQYNKVTMIPAAHVGDGKDTCQGDSGGPLSVAYDSQGFKRVTQVGIVSWGRGCGNIGIYSRVSTYLDWIDDTIKANKQI